MKSPKMGSHVSLDPLGYTREQAEAMVGKRLVELVRNNQGNLVDGRQGSVIASEQAPTYEGNQYSFLVAVQWTDRDGNRSRPFTYSKQQVDQLTRPLRIQEIAALEAERRQQHQLKPDSCRNSSSRRPSF